MPTHTHQNGNVNPPSIDNAIKDIWKACHQGHITFEAASLLEQKLRLERDGTDLDPCALRRREKMRQWRMWGGQQCLPPEVRACYTFVEQLILRVIATDIKRTGICEKTNAHIAAIAKCCRRMVTRVKAKACTNGHVVAYKRQTTRNYSLSTILKIADKNWKNWLQRGPCESLLSSRVNEKSNKKNIDYFFLRPTANGLHESSGKSVAPTPWAAALCPDTG